jgi:hypothetical protein
MAKFAGCIALIQVGDHEPSEELCLLSILTLAYPLSARGASFGCPKEASAMTAGIEDKMRILLQ